MAGAPLLAFTIRARARAVPRAARAALLVAAGLLLAPAAASSSPSEPAPTAASGEPGLVVAEDFEDLPAGATAPGLVGRAVEVASLAPRLLPLSADRLRDLSDGAVTFWFRPSAAVNALKPGERVLLMAAERHDRFSVALEAGGGLSCALNGRVLRATTPDGRWDGRWQFAAAAWADLQFDAGEARLLLNGEVADTQAGGGPTLSLEGGVALAPPGGARAAVLLDEVCWYDQGLSTAALLHRWEWARRRAVEPVAGGDYFENTAAQEGQRRFLTRFPRGYYVLRLTLAVAFVLGWSLLFARALLAAGRVLAAWRPGAATPDDPPPPGGGATLLAGGFMVMTLVAGIAAFALSSETRVLTWLAAAAGCALLLAGERHAAAARPASRLTGPRPWRPALLVAFCFTWLAAPLWLRGVDAGPISLPAAPRTAKAADAAVSPGGDAWTALGHSGRRVDAMMGEAAGGWPGTDAAGNQPPSASAAGHEALAAETGRFLAMALGPVNGLIVGPLVLALAAAMLAMPAFTLARRMGARAPFAAVAAFFAGGGFATFALMAADGSGVIFRSFLAWEMAAALLTWRRGRWDMVLCATVAALASLVPAAAPLGREIAGSAFWVVAAAAGVLLWRARSWKGALAACAALWAAALLATPAWTEAGDRARQPAAADSARDFFDLLAGRDANGLPPVVVAAPGLFAAGAIALSAAGLLAVAARRWRRRWPRLRPGATATLVEVLFAAQAAGLFFLLLPAPNLLLALSVPPVLALTLAAASRGWEWSARAVRDSLAVGRRPAGERLVRALIAASAALFGFAFLHLNGVFIKRAARVAPGPERLRLLDSIRADPELAPGDAVLVLADPPTERLFRLGLRGLAVRTCEETLLTGSDGGFFRPASTPPPRAPRPAPRENWGDRAAIEAREMRGIAPGAAVASGAGDAGDSAPLAPRDFDALNPEIAAAAKYVIVADSAGLSDPSEAFKFWGRAGDLRVFRRRRVAPIAEHEGDVLGVYWQPDIFKRVPVELMEPQPGEMGTRRADRGLVTRFGPGPLGANVKSDRPLVRMVLAGVAARPAAIRVQLTPADPGEKACVIEVRAPRGPFLISLPLIDTSDPAHARRVDFLLRPGSFKVDVFPPESLVERDRAGRGTEDRTGPTDPTDPRPSFPAPRPSPATPAVALDYLGFDDEDNVDKPAAWLAETRRRAAGP
ncbi:MAG: hypothetical protein HY719_10585 [Planctomycetes bacterium]|nr:hypothetical protein [Planctomycetota bacterium]